ncbi:MAG: hypothetical protein NT154_16030, partial [Verrucomicrobia bacterium]|nr:hypothetical protein [Verrucomicrobiota bacterium]
NLTANVGASISFVAQAIACPSPDLYQWYFEGSPIPEATNSTYQLTNARKADAGSYWAVLSGPGWGLQTSPVITLTVLAEPTVTSAPQSQMAYAGSTLAFQVSASGAAPLAYQWFLNGNALASATGAGLCLTNLQVSQSGLYSLVVTNAFGAATSPPVCLTVVVGPPPTYTVLHHFTGSDGNGPWANLTLSDDTIYGTTVNGGLANSGTVFKVNTNGSGFTVLKRFAGGSDGQIPFGGLTLDGSTLYGTTGGGGTTNEAGTVFKLNTDGSGYAVLQQFNGSDGRQPMCSLLLSNSTLFGTALMGGSSNYGTVFKIGIDGSGFSLLKQFTRADGAFPASGLVLSGTSLYGGTESGGNSQCGVLFGIHPEGTGSTVLKEFSGRDGYGVYGGLVSSGSVLYGTTRYGGAPGLGTVFKIKTDGTGFSVLKTFTTNDAGIDPRGDLTLVGSTLYGTLAKGGDSGCGAVFRIKTDGSGYLVLKRFMGGSDGAFPVGGLTFSGTALYATTQQGGISNCGLIFALSLPVPNILTPPGSQTAEAGTSPVFTVQAEGDPSVTYQWSFNGTNVLGAATTSAFLQLIDVQPPQAGW